MYRQQRPLLPRMNIRENSPAAFLVLLFLGTQKEYFFSPTGGRPLQTGKSKLSYWPYDTTPREIAQ